MCRPKWPPFKAIFSSGDTPFQDLLQLQRPYFYFWNKKCIFRPNLHQFWLNFSWDTNFSIEVLSRDASFKPRNQLRRTYFWKPGLYIPTQIFFEYPPPGPLLEPSWITFRLYRNKLLYIKVTWEELSYKSLWNILVIHEQTLQIQARLHTNPSQICYRNPVPQAAQLFFSLCAKFSSAEFCVLNSAVIIELLCQQFNCLLNSQAKKFALQICN